jgi:dephospho-CoA kinase
VIVISGSIASGNSTVARVLARGGASHATAAVVDLDLEMHEHGGQPESKRRTATQETCTGTRARPHGGMRSPLNSR